MSIQEQEVHYFQQPPLNPPLSTGNFEDFSPLDGFDTARIADYYLRRRSMYQLDNADRISPVVGAFEIPIAPNLGKDSSLKKTGWNHELEINTLFLNYNRYVREGKTSHDSLQLSFAELEANVRTFTLEFIQARLVIPFLVSLDPDSEYGILSKYDNQPIVYKTSSQERLGANKKVVKIIDKFMKGAPAGSMAIENSPSGETGWVDEEGKPIIYTDNQMTIYIKDWDGSFRALTIVSDLDYDQSRQYSIDMGVDGQVLSGTSEMEKVANIVRNPILLSFPRGDQSPIEYAIDKLLAIRGRGDIKIQKKDGNFEYKPVSELIDDIAKRESMLNFCEEAEGVIGQLRDYFFSQIDNLADFDIQKAVSDIVVKAILEITRINRPQKDSNIEISKESLSRTNYFSGISKTFYTPAVAEWMQRDYRPEIAYLENQKGCQGGRSNISGLGGVSLGAEFTGETMPSTVTIADLKDKDFCIRCGACREYIWCVVRRGQKCPKCPAIKKCG